MLSFLCPHVNTINTSMSFLHSPRILRDISSLIRFPKKYRYPLARPAALLGVTTASLELILAQSLIIIFETSTEEKRERDLKVIILKDQ